MTFTNGVTLEVRWSAGSDSHNKRRHLGVTQPTSPTAEVNVTYPGVDRYGNPTGGHQRYTYCTPEQVAHITLEASQMR